MADKPNPIITESVEARFWSKVDKSPGHGPNGDCWLWVGGFNEFGGGYPRSFTITIAGKARAYRGSHIALAIVGRPRPDPSLLALHSCDNPPCVNPDHLRWGTSEENHQDARERGIGGRRGFKPEEIRAIRASTGRHVDVAREYGVTSACILNIRKRVTHKNVI